MEALIRERRQVGGGSVELQDREVSGRAISIGSAPDQIVQLLGADVAPRHAQLTGKAGAVRIVCVGRHRVDVNGKSVRSATLEQGDRIELGGHVLEVIAAPAGFDLALELTPNTAVRASAFEAAFQTRLQQTLIGKRSLAWLLLGAVLLGGLGAPLYELRSRGEGGEQAEAVPHWLPKDVFWSTGPLLPAHELIIGDDCSYCHVELFQRVQDAQCTMCHTAVLDHLSEPLEASLGVDRCATCHREHNDPRYFVVRRDTLCTDCHASPHEFPAGVDVEPVSGFAAATHPPFDLHLLVPQAERVGELLSFEWVSRIASGEDPQEQSNLKFPHDVHLDAAKVQRPTNGAVLGCGDCHTLSTDNEHFLPIQMERHCRECHELTFDVEQPARQLPHGQPTEVVFALEGHFMRKYGAPDAAEQGRRPRRVPDRSTTDDVCTDGAYQCAQRRTVQEVTNQFSVRGCVTCHVVEDNGSADIYQRFQVFPVRLQGDYYPASNFPHQSHLTQGDATGDAACLTCHAATASQASADLMVPGEDNCLECHGDRAVRRSLVPLDCVSCHSYHPRQRSAVLDVTAR